MRLLAQGHPCFRPVVWLLPVAPQGPPLSSIQPVFSIGHPPTLAGHAIYPSPPGGLPLAGSSGPPSPGETSSCHQRRLEGDRCFGSPFALVVCPILLANPFSHSLCPGSLHTAVFAPLPAALYPAPDQEIYGGKDGRYPFFRYPGAGHSFFLPEIYLLEQ